MSRILVIDDDPIIRQMGKAYFTAKGHEVMTAVDGKDGIEKYRGGKFDLVIVDLMMETVDAGTAFVKELRLMNNRAPIYMLSSVGSALGQNIDTQALGLAGVLQKPFDPNTLLTLLKTKLK